MMLESTIFATSNIIGLVETFFIKRRTLKALLKKVNIKSDSQDYELVMSLLLSSFYCKLWKTDTLIGFKLKDKHAGDIPAKGKANLLTIREVIKKYTDSNTPIDVVISPEKIRNMGRKTNKGVAFQLKRFRKHKKGDITETFLEYLTKEIPQRYTKTNTKLLIIPEKVNFVNWKIISKRFNPKSYPFSAVMFYGVSNGLIFIGEIWPNPGMNKYHPSELL